MFGITQISMSHHQKEVGQLPYIGENNDCFEYYLSIIVFSSDGC